MSGNSNYRPSSLGSSPSYISKSVVFVFCWLELKRNVFSAMERSDIAQKCRVDNPGARVTLVLS